MIKFRKTKPQVEVPVKVEAEHAEALQKHIQNISDSLTPEQISKLSKLCNNPVLKNIALKKLEEYI